jgi:hypothetical protein
VTHRARRDVSVFLALCCAAGAHAQRPAVLRGSVLKDANDAPIAGAEVAIPRLGIGVASDSAGNFRLSAIVPGQQIVWVRKLGFAPISAVLTFAAGDTLERDFAMAVVAQALPGVSVTAPPPVPPKLSQFEERRKAAFGHFITQDQLEKNEDRLVSEVLVAVPGLRIVQAGARGAYVGSARDPGKMTAARKPVPCFSAVVLDGAFVYQGIDPREPLWDINSIQTNQIAGIEYYAGGATMPAQYNGTRSTCGLVVIWTK